MARRFRSFALLMLPTVLLTALGGCTQDPFERPGTWKPIGANEHNLRAMVASPDHLERGVAADTERGSAASTAVTRLLIERRRQLPNVRTSTIGGGGVQQQQQAADPPLPGLGGTGGTGGASR